MQFTGYYTPTAQSSTKHSCSIGWTRFPLLYLNIQVSSWKQDLNTSQYHIQAGTSPFQGFLIKSRKGSADLCILLLPYNCWGLQCPSRGIQTIRKRRHKGSAFFWDINSAMQVQTHLCRTTYTSVNICFPLWLADDQVLPIHNSDVLNTIILKFTQWVRNQQKKIQAKTLPCLKRCQIRIQSWAEQPTDLKDFVSDIQIYFYKYTIFLGNGWH